jgi:hypothetical protein
MAPVSPLRSACSNQRNAAQASGLSTGSATAQASKGTSVCGSASNWPSANTRHLRRRQRQQRRHAPIDARVPVSRDDDDGTARVLQRAQRCLGQGGVAQALGLDETGKDLIWERVAMGLLLFRLAKGLLLGIKRLGQAEPRRIAGEHGRGALAKRPPRRVPGHLGAVDSGALGMGRAVRTSRNRASQRSPSPARRTSASASAARPGVTSAAASAVIISKTTVGRRTHHGILQDVMGGIVMYLAKDHDLRRAFAARSVAVRTASARGKG